MGAVLGVLFLFGFFVVILAALANEEADGTQSPPPRQGFICQKVKEYDVSPTRHYSYKLIIYGYNGVMQDVIRVSEFDYYKFFEGTCIKYTYSKKGLENIWLDEKKEEELK